MRSLALISLLVATGCSAAVVEDGQGEEVDLTEASALNPGGKANVAVERVVALSSSMAPPVGLGPSMVPAASQTMRTHVSARFVRVRGAMDHQTAQRVVGSGGGLSPQAALGCAWQDGADDAPVAALDEGAIELLDVGDITLRAGSTAMPLAARAFPDVGDLVSGVVYTSRDDTTELPADGSYAIDVTGSPFIEGFSLQVDAPGAPTGVLLVQLGNEAQPLEAPELELTPSEDLSLSWDVTRDGQPDASGDRVYIEISDADSSAVLRCVFDDVGNGVVPASMMTFPSSSEIDIAVHRHRRTVLNRQARLNTGIDEAVVDFDFGIAARASTSE